MHDIPPLKNSHEPDSIDFEKYHANGNDFIIVDGSSYSTIENNLLTRLQKQAPAWCDRHRGIGADGIFLVKEEPDYLAMHVINADGSLAKNCGNGLRCVAQWFFRRHPTEHSVTIRLSDKDYVAKPLANEFLVNMGLCSIEKKPDFVGKKAALAIPVFQADVGNQHLVFLAEDEEDPVALIARIKESYPQWQEFNLGLVLGRTHRSVVYERGVGFTESCGSGAIAAAMALFAIGEFAQESILIAQPGGEIAINLRLIENNPWHFAVSQKGNASFVFLGRAFF